MPSITRRQALRRGGALAAAGAVGTQPTQAQGTDALGLPPVSPSRTVDAVDDLGWDPTGQEPIVRIPWRDVHIRVPPGRYLVNHQQTVSGVQNWILEGTGDSHQDVQFTIPAGEERRVFSLTGCENIRVRNLSFNQREDWETAIGNVFVGPDNIGLSRIELIGNEDIGTKDLSVRATDPDGIAVVNGFRRVGGTRLVPYDSDDNNTMCFHAGPDHEGTLHLLNFELENCGSSGIYASRTTGPVKVVGGRFMNIQNAPIRVSGTGSAIRNVTLIIDTEHENTERNRGEYDQTRGIWWESGFQEQSGGLIDGVDIICRNTPATPGLLRINGTAGSMTIRNVRIENHVDDMAYIWAREPGSSSMGGQAGGAGQYPHAVEIDTVHLTGSSSGSKPAILVEDRPGSTVTNACIDLDGSRSGIALVNSADSSVHDCGIDVSGTDVRTPASDGAVVSRISNTASCQAPSADAMVIGEPNQVPDEFNAHGALWLVGGGTLALGVTATVAGVLYGSYRALRSFVDPGDSPRSR